MSYERRIEFRPGAWLKPCHMCGIRYRNYELRKGEDGFYRCLRYCVEIPALTRDKISAESQRRREAPPPPDGQPYDQLETFGQERQILWFLTEMGGSGAAFSSISEQYQVNSGTPTAATSGTAPNSFIAWAEACRYFYNLITEGKRPASWIAQAKTKMQSVLTSIIAQQVGFGQSTNATLGGSVFYGAFVDVSTLATHCQSQAAMGLACLYGYRVFGTYSYLASAIGALHYLRNMQSEGQYFSSNFTSSDAAGTVHLYTGGVVDTIDGFGRPNHRFFPQSLLALTFMKEMYATLGDGTYGCTTTISGFFTAPPQALLSQMIADLRAFWAVGAYDNTLGKTVTGLSATNPAEFFNAYPATHTGYGGRQGTGTGSWEYQDNGPTNGTLVTGTNLAEALRALYAYEGYSSQVSSIWAWLMGFQANPAYVLPAGTLKTDYACVTSTSAANPPSPPAGAGNVVAPFYDPTQALSTLLLVRDPTNNYAATAQNGSSLYDWSTTGLLAAIQSSQNQAALKKAKLAMCAGYSRLPVTFADQAQGFVVDYPMLRGTTGLSMQMAQNDSGNGQFWSVWAASRCGNAFRYQPNGFTGANPPWLAPGVSAG